MKLFKSSKDIANHLDQHGYSVFDVVPAQGCATHTGWFLFIDGHPVSN